MDPDMNKYDLEHVVTPHPLMSKEEWQGAYRSAWKQYYSLSHVETVLRRVAAKRQKVDKVMSVMFRFHGSFEVEGIHPLEGGVFRRKVRTTRRAGLPLENPLLFYPRRVWESISSNCQWVMLYWQFRQIANRVKNDPQRRKYTDLATIPVAEEREDLNLLEMPTAHIPIANEVRMRHIVNL